MIWKSSSIEEDKTYALMDWLSEMIDKTGVFTDSSGNQVRIGDHIYVVGGAVRNFVLGRPIKDIDIVIDAVALSTRKVARGSEWLADEILRAAPITANINKVSNNFGVEILSIRGEWLHNGIDIGGQEIEIAFARNESYRDGGYKPEEVTPATIEEDAKRRDFTINTLMWSFADLWKSGPSEEIIQDPLGVGRRDLENMEMNTPLDPKETFRDDASRMLRTVKFKMKYGLKTSKEVDDAIKNNPEFLRNVPNEQIYSLLTSSILNLPNYKTALEEMSQNNMLSEIIRALESDRAFRGALSGWIEKNRDVKYLFEMIDFGLPLGGRVGFLDDSDIPTVRKNIENLSSDRQTKYLNALKNVGSTINDKSFFMRAFNEIRGGAGLGERDIPIFRMKFYGKSARMLLLDDPSLMDDSDRLKRVMMEKMKRIIEKDENTLDDIEAAMLSSITKTSSLSDSMSMPIPEFNGVVYIFDFDDTLFWTPEWHSIVNTNNAGVVSSVSEGTPNTTHRALAFVGRANKNPEDVIKKNSSGNVSEELLEEYKAEIGELTLTREVVDIPFLGKKDQVLFALSDSSGNAIDLLTLKKYFSSRSLKHFDLREKYAKNKAVIAGDYQFYKTPDTLGYIPNEDILKIYNTHSNNSVVLTAREAAPGMREGIVERLAAVGASAPLEVFVRPMAESGGKYKANIIGRIASQPGVTGVEFYDDNLKYITDVKKSLSENYGEEISSIVNIHKVDVDKKPEESMHVMSFQSPLRDIIKIANELDNRGLVHLADELDLNILKFAGKKKKALYSAAFLTKDAKNDLYNWWTKTLGNQLLDRTFMHHMTISFKPSPEEVLAAPIGEFAKLKVIGYSSDENGQAVLVSGVGSSNNLPHITISTAKGVSPVYSNELLLGDVTEVDGIELEAQIGFFNGKEPRFDLEGSIYEG